MLRSLGVGITMVFCVACVGQPRGDGAFGDAGVASGADATGPSATGAGPADDGGSAGSEGSGGDGRIKLDVSPGQSSADDGGSGIGCDKIDFLFVIDNSGSMSHEQQNLINSFPGFISTIRDTLQAQDYHLMVVDTDATGGGGSSTTCINGVCTCSPAPGCCATVCMLQNNCNGMPCNMIPGSDCDGTLGAGKVFREDGTECLTDGGPRFMTDQTPDLDATFACAAEVGTFGSGREEPMHAMLLATGAELGAPGACNENFLRDDAILVVTFITDEEDDGKSPGDPPSWTSDLIATKGGDPDAVVVLGLFGDHDEAGAGCAVTPDNAEPAPRLRQFVESFGNRGVVGSVCAPDYTPFFADAVSVIDLACDEFIPPG